MKVTSRAVFITLVFIANWLIVTPGQAGSNLSVNEKNGLPFINIGGSQILSSKYVFWGKDWTWAGLKTTFKTDAPYHYSTLGVNKHLDFDLTSSSQKVTEKQLTWSFDLDAKTSKSDVIGGGIAFKLNSSGPGNALGEPVLLPNNAGWKWGNSPNKGVIVEFVPALASIKFERGRKSEIRAFFYKGEIAKGKQQYLMTVTLYGDIGINPTLSERFALAKSATWQKDAFDWQTFPVDLSFLNTNERPAGKRGFVSAKGEKLVFTDGSEARFWGTNITARTLFQTSKLNIKIQAARLSKMGFNLVRLHHHDSFWVNPNIFGPKTVQDTQKLDRDSLDKLDWWIKSLKDEGIYVWLDLHVQRHLRIKDDIFAFDEIHKKKKHPGSDLKGFNYVNSSIKNAMKRFNQSYVAHVNPYTDLAYKDDPAIVAMLVTNENDITNHFGNSLLPNKKVPRHNEIYMQEAKAFASNNGLDARKAWRSWEHGPAKLFLNDLEHRFNKEMIEDLRQSGVKVPIVTTSTWGNNPLSALPALTTGDLIDVHVYGEVLEIEKNPLYTPGMLSWMAAGQIAGKPMSVSEWNVSPFPAPDRHSSPMLVASKASHQGWDALVQYAYSQNSLNKAGKPSNWHAHNDPSLLAILPAAALLYRQGHVKQATSTYYLEPGADTFDENISAKTSSAIRTASEKGKLVISMPKTRSLPWLVHTPPLVGSKVIKDYTQSFIAANAKSVTSDTGELHRNWEEGLYTINAWQSQAAMGWVGDKTIKLADVEFQLSTRNATVAVQSLDKLPINSSRNILLSLAANAVPYKDLKGRSKLPFRSEPVKGTIKVTAPPGLQLYPVSNEGNRDSVPVNYVDGRYIIELDKLPLLHWLSLSE